MEYGSVVGLNKPVARIVLGTMIVTSQEADRSRALLDAVFEQGGNTLDTAHGYAGGYSERGIGDWMYERGIRDEMVIITKGCHHNADRKRVTPFDLTSDLFDSLARLRTDTIDLYFLHRDDPDVPVGEIVDVLNEHHTAGRIRAFGGSNWTHTRIAEANAYARTHNLVPFVASSPNYGLADQIENPWGPGCVSLSGPGNAAGRTWYESEGMPIFAYSSLARGLFSGRVTRSNFDETREMLDGACQRAYCHEPNLKRLDRAHELAAEKGITVPQLVLAFMYASPLDVFPIVGAANGDEYAENIKAFDVALTPTECAWLDLKSDSR